MKWPDDRVTGDASGDRVDDVNLERLGDAVSRRIFQLGTDDQAIVARPPRGSRSELPSGFFRLHGDPAGNGFSGCILHDDQAIEQGPVQRLGEPDFQGTPSPGRRVAVCPRSSGRARSRPAARHVMSCGTPP